VNTKYYPDLPTIIMAARKCHPTLRLHITKEDVDYAKSLMREAMHRYFQGRKVAVDWQDAARSATVGWPTPPAPATKEWEFLVAYATDACTVPPSEIEEVINVYVFKIVDGPDGMFFQTEATCEGCAHFFNRQLIADKVDRHCLCHRWLATAKVVAEVQARVWGDEPEPCESLTASAQTQTDPEEAQENTAERRSWKKLAQEKEALEKEVDSWAEATGWGVSPRTRRRWTEVNLPQPAPFDAEEAVKEENTADLSWAEQMEQEETGMWRVDGWTVEDNPPTTNKTAPMSCQAPAFVPGTVPLQAATTVDWSWCPEVPSQRACTSWRPLTPPPAPVGTNRRRSCGVLSQSMRQSMSESMKESMRESPAAPVRTDPYSHIRETADASYRPTVGELTLPHCTFCKNSGEPYAVYRGHTVRGSTGEVECHKLLSIECLRCHQRGHTVSHCTGPPPPPPTPEAESFYCQFCFTSGGDEFAYRSHNLRDADGNTNCQKLLNTQCRNCNKLGHTQRYCDQEQTQQRRGFRGDRQRRSRAPSPPSPPDVSNHRDFPSLLPPPLAPDTPEPIPRSS
jgi:hypothetical protein